MTLLVFDKNENMTYICFELYVQSGNDVILHYKSGIDFLSIITNYKSLKEVISSLLSEGIFFVLIEEDIDSIHYDRFLFKSIDTILSKCFQIDKEDKKDDID